jgi:hypothetical protein
MVTDTIPGTTRANEPLTIPLSVKNWLKIAQRLDVVIVTDSVVQGGVMLGVVVGEGGLIKVGLTKRAS